MTLHLRPSKVFVTATTLVVTIAIATGCSSASKSETTPAPSTTAAASVRTAPAGTYGVGRLERTFVDTKRPTDAHGGQPERPERTLDTLILYPTARHTASGSTRPVAGATPLAGPWPVIVFGHGSTRKPDDYIGKLAYWASAGYVIVAPAFPLSKQGTPGGTAYGDYTNQTGDESFIIDTITTDNAAPLHLKSLIDAKAIGLGGQSFGAVTALGTVAAQCCADKRIRAATTFAGSWLPYPSKDALASWASDVPVLFFHGSDDPTLPYANDHGFFERLGAPGGFVTLVGSGHDPGFFDATETPLDTLVSETSLAFYDQHLKGGPDSIPIIERLVAKAGPTVAKFEASPKR